jgi:hypothetical protein
MKTGFELFMMIFLVYRNMGRASLRAGAFKKMKVGGTRTRIKILSLKIAVTC